MNITDIIPHRPPLLFIDKVTDPSPTKFETEAIISNDTLLVEAETLPSWALTEFMAQSVALYGGMNSNSESRNVKKALVIKIDNFKSTTPEISTNKNLKFITKPQTLTSTLGKFEVEAHLDGAPIASGQFTLMYS